MIYNLFLLDKLDLKDKVSKITRKNKYYWGGGVENAYWYKQDISAPNETMSFLKKVKCLLQCRKIFYFRNKKKKTNKKNTQI